jgi:hypothetical protein
MRRGQPIGPWLLRVTHYLAIDAMRSNSARRRHEQAFARARGEAAQIGQPPWRSIEPMLDAALHELSSADRVILTLRYLQDWTIEQTAQELRIEPAAVRQRLSRALRRLRKVLANRGMQRADFFPLVLPRWIRVRRWLGRLIPGSSGGLAVVVGGMVICASGLFWSMGAMHRAPVTTNHPAIKSPGVRAQSTVP